MVPTNPDSEYIHIKGARSNNLKNIEVKIPKNTFVVVTGVSGSGKSSLVMETLYAEGQRRYVESLSSYARQFLNRMKKPEVDFIKGLAPAIAIEQKVLSSNARSTVGTLTEIYDYLRVLYAKIGVTYSPVSGNQVTRHHISDVVDFIFSLDKGSKIQLFFPLKLQFNTKIILVSNLVDRGFARILHHGKLSNIEDINIEEIEDELLVLVDRFVVNDDTENIKRVADSISTAFLEGNGETVLEVLGGDMHRFNNRFEIDGIVFDEPTHQMFNFNNPLGACTVCEGYGKALGYSEEKIIPDTQKSVYEGAIAPWETEGNKEIKHQFLEFASSIDFPVFTPYRNLTKMQKKLLWSGNEDFLGILPFFKLYESQSYKIQNKVFLARYRGQTVCTECQGTRLRNEALYVKIQGYDISELVQMPVDELLEFFKNIKISEYQAIIAKRLVVEIQSRLNTMVSIGLSYLSLDRLSSTLSGGETQRINLTRTLGSNLTDSIYILDEPSIGLHPADTGQLIKVLGNLRDLGNTVIVVEHEEEIIRAADQLLDIGPAAGIHGGELVYQGTIQSEGKDVCKSLTLSYLNGDTEIPLFTTKRNTSNRILVNNVSKYNIENLSIEFPTQALTVIAGVSGSGKSTLINQVIVPELTRIIEWRASMRGPIESFISGNLNKVSQLEFVNQNPIGRSSRSNPVTYTKAFDSIRKLFAKQQLAKIRGYEAGHFSYNVPIGRCDNCQGDGEITVEMQFLADVKLLCEDCNGMRYKKEILDIKYKDKNISDVLNLTVAEALEYFDDNKEIYQKLLPLEKVGLSYLKLGQSSSTLSGGEAQRVKLASFLSKDSKSVQMLFIFDEPSTGLHFSDIEKLMIAINDLIEQGHTVIIIEHNVDIIKNADWVIELGPGGGKHGGKLVYQGPIKGIFDVHNSITAPFLKNKMSPI